MLLIGCIAAGALAVVHLVVSYFWDKKWLGIFPILSYLCCSAAMIDCFYDVARRTQAGDVGGLLDIYPTISNGFIFVLGVVTVFHVLAIVVRGKGKLYQ